MAHMMHIVNHEGRHFNVRIVYKGDRYGRADCLTLDANEKSPLVEFYDATYTDKFGERGQFVSRYYAGTLLGWEGFYGNTRRGEGLDLMGYEPAWKIDGKTMNLVRDWIEMNTRGELI